MPSRRCSLSGCYSAHLEDVGRKMSLDAQALLYGVLDLLHRAYLPSFVVFAITSEVDRFRALRAPWSRSIACVRPVHRCQCCEVR